MMLSTRHVATKASFLGSHCRSSLISPGPSLASPCSSSLSPRRWLFSRSASELIVSQAEMRRRRVFTHSDSPPLFDCPGSPDAALVNVVALPWDNTMTTFEHTGRTINQTPQRILNCALTMDTVDVDLLEFGLAFPHLHGISLDVDSDEVRQVAVLNERSAEILSSGNATGKEPVGNYVSGDVHAAGLKAEQLEQAHSLWRQQVDIVENQVLRLLERGKLVGCVGGDHMASFPAMKAFGRFCASKGETFGILQVDAHLDLYDVYNNGLQSSHACVIKRVLEETEALDAVVAVGIRELGKSEIEAHLADERHRIFSAADLRRCTSGDPAGRESWRATVKKIVAHLPKHVWVTFDIDGLDIAYCAGTGTPVPGGLSYLQAVDLLLEIHRSGRVVCGWDLVEVGTVAGGTNVGARLAYKLSGLQMLGAGARDLKPVKLRSTH